MFVCCTYSCIWIPKLKIELWTSCVVFRLSTLTASFTTVVGSLTQSVIAKVIVSHQTKDNHSWIPWASFIAFPYLDTHWFLCHSLEGLSPNDLWGMARVKIWRDILGHHITVIILWSDKDNFYRPVFHMLANEHRPDVSRSTGCRHIVGHKDSPNIIHTYRNIKLDSNVHAFT